MFGHSPDTFHFIRILDIECLNTTVVKNVPQFNHAFGISCNETIEV